MTTTNTFPKIDLGSRRSSYDPRTVRASIGGMIFVGSLSTSDVLLTAEASQAECIAGTIRKVQQVSEGKPERAQVVHVEREGDSGWAVLINALPARDEPSERPQVGQGFSFGGNGDMYPCTITHVSPSGKTVQVVRCDSHVSTRVNAYQEGEREAVFFSCPDMELGHVRTFTLRRNGRWMEKGASMNGWGGGHPGRRATSYNPHF